MGKDNLHDFVLNIEGFYREDLTSEILKYILSKENYSTFQTDFFNKLISVNNGKDSQKNKFVISTQTIFKEGRPDLRIENEETIVLIENKFFAPFNKDDQIQRYSQIIDKYFSQKSIKIVCVLTIRDRIPYYNKLLKNELNILAAEMGFEFKFLAWEDILNLDTENDFIVQNLKHFVGENYIKKGEYSKIEDWNEPLKGPLRDRISFLFEILKQNNFQIRDFRNLKNNYLGAYISKPNNTNEIWLGYALPFWRKIRKNNDSQTPLFIQIRKAWLNTAIGRKHEETLKHHIFEYYRDFEWIRSLDSSEIENEDNFINLIKEIYSTLTKMSTTNTR